MPQFSGPGYRPAMPSAPVQTTGELTRTATGGTGHLRTAASELFVLAASYMVGKDEFHERASDRERRLVELTRQVTAEDPEWVARFVPFLRDTMQIRSASVIIACEYVKAGGPSGRRVVSGACQRADEPAEVLGYWVSRYGRRIPKAVKRGVADAANRLYTERAVHRYDGLSRAWRMGDVCDVTHPDPVDPHQRALFRYVLDVRHSRPASTLVLDGSLAVLPDGTRVAEPELPLSPLPALAENRRLMAVPEAQRRALLREDPAIVQRAGWSWERLAGWLPGGMDAEAWTLAIPLMGYSALLRNLRNFDDAGLPDDVAARVTARLVDPVEVSKSRQFPVRFLSAWAATSTLRWGHALETGIGLALENVPALPGRTLILVDLSGSMVDERMIAQFHGPEAARSVVKPWMTAGIFGLALAKRAASAELYVYGQRHERVPVGPSTSILRVLDTFRRTSAWATGTATLDTIAELYRGHDRVVVLTDEQAFQVRSYGAREAVSRVPLIYTWNLAGYRAGHLPSGSNGRYTFGGLSDAAFRMLPLLEQHKDGVWPF
jgi:hypothetical protein